MSSPDPALSEPSDGPAAEDFARAALDRQMAGLERLAEIGLEIAEAVAAQVRDPAQTFDGAAVSLAYHRTARAVRMSYALQTRVIELIRDLPRHAANAERFRAAKVAAASLMPQTPLAIRKTEIGQALSTVLDHEHRSDLGSEAHERHVREATERLKDADDLGDILTRPISDIIAQVCKDLGLNPDWEGLASEAWALENARGRKSSPSPWMGEGSRVGVEASPERGDFEEGFSAPSKSEAQSPDSPQAEPAPPPIPTLSPIQGERAEVEPPQPDPEPPPPQPYYPPKLEDIYSAEAYARSNGRTLTLNYDPAGLTGELPPLRRDGRPASYILPPCNYDHGCFD